MSIANNIKKSVDGSSWIRKMFNEGNRLKAKYGSKKIYDFSLGNPNIAPPEEFYVSLKNIVASSGAGSHAYMPQTGYPETCESVAKQVTEEQGIATSKSEIIMTCGASGAINIILKSILNPLDEVICPVPCFVEYESYIDNHGGVFKTIKTNNDFSLNLEKLSNAINEKTKAVIINSPNNPTGKVYADECLEELGKLLNKKNKEYDKIIYLISDEPYRKIIFNDINVPSIFKNYSDSIVITSYSKDLSIPGERIGFAAVNPRAKYRDDLISAMALSNRILGFVNAPAIMQRVISNLQGKSVDVGEYKRKRDLLCDGLSAAGYDFTIPSGAFYLFPRSPIEDDVSFVRALQKELILVVPGSGFKGPGHFRIAFCVDDETIIGSISGFKKVIETFR